MADDPVKRLDVILRRRRIVGGITVAIALLVIGALVLVTYEPKRSGGYVSATLLTFTPMPSDSGVSARYTAVKENGKTLFFNTPSPDPTLSPGAPVCLERRVGQITGGEWLRVALLDRCKDDAT